jgi:N-acyl-L-homoserine lactone synthetase
MLDRFALLMERNLPMRPEIIEKSRFCPTIFAFDRALVYKTRTFYEFRPSSQSGAALETAGRQS